MAKQFLAEIKPGREATVVALKGNLGSGKTTFAQFVGEALGVRDPIQSPTFLIEKIYELTDKPWKFLIHIDAYRLEREEELQALGWEEMVSRSDNLILIEWPEKVSGILPESAYHILFMHGEGEDLNSREIEFKRREE